MEKRRSSPSCCSSNDRLGDGCNTRAVTSWERCTELRLVTVHESFRLAVGNLEGWQCFAWSSDKFSGATSGRCRQMVLQKPTVGLASFPRRLACSFRLLRPSVECLLSLVANFSSRFIYDFFLLHAHLVRLTQPLHKSNPGTQFRPPHLIYSPPAWLHAEAVGGEKLQSGGQTWRERKVKKKKTCFAF